MDYKKAGENLKNFIKEVRERRADFTAWATSPSKLNRGNFIDPIKKEKDSMRLYYMGVKHATVFWNLTGLVSLIIAVYYLVELIKQNILLKQQNDLIFNLLEQWTKL